MYYVHFKYIYRYLCSTYNVPPEKNLNDKRLISSTITFVIFSSNNSFLWCFQWSKSRSFNQLKRCTWLQNTYTISQQRGKLLSDAILPGTERTVVCTIPNLSTDRVRIATRKCYWVMLTFTTYNLLPTWRYRSITVPKPSLHQVLSATTLLSCISCVVKEICKGFLQRIFNHVAGI